MPRYIDADALLSRLPDDLPYKASVKRVLMQAPEADVIPKNEVQKIFEEIEKCMAHDYISSIGVYSGALELRIAELKKKHMEEKV